MYQYLTGGLGNQLFQYSMLHFVVQSTNLERSVVWIDQNPRNDRPFLLQEICSSCPHISRVEKPFSGLRGLATRVATKFAHGIIYSQFGAQRWPEMIQYEFNNTKQYLEGRNKFWIGYFQNYRYVEAVWPTVKAEIFQHLERIKIPEFLPAKYVVVHVRGGDFFNLSSTQGVLSAKYYKEALSKFFDLSKLDIVLVTDDIDNAERVSVEIKPDFIIGPKTLNEWETLKLMSNAHGLIMANSTFSWWGGRIALEQGCKVFLPSPWVKIDHLNVGNAFQHPDFFPIVSSFEE